jgi:GntR family negative regulator for fad regulon and positive regulator of fabA
MNWSPPPRPAQVVEQRLLRAVLDGTFPPGSNLPGERQLAQQLGVTRPTLREALHRLASDGWFDIRHGVPTRVCDYWREGNLNVLGTLVRYSEHLPANFVSNLLAVRLCLAPAYTRAAVARAPGRVSELLDGYERLNDEASSFASADWNLHQGLTVASGNPVFTLILNGFAGFYVEMASRYFSQPEARATSRAWYTDLHQFAARRDPDGAETGTRRVMEKSIQLWEAVSQET